MTAPGAGQPVPRQRHVLHIVEHQQPAGHGLEPLADRSGKLPLVGGAGIEAERAGEGGVVGGQGGGVSARSHQTSG